MDEALELLKKNGYEAKTFDQGGQTIIEAQKAGKTYGAGFIPDGEDSKWAMTIANQIIEQGG